MTWKLREISDSFSWMEMWSGAPDIEGAGDYKPDSYYINAAIDFVSKDVYSRDWAYLQALEIVDTPIRRLHDRTQVYVTYDLVFESEEMYIASLIIK